MLQDAFSEGIPFERRQFSIIARILLLYIKMGIFWLCIYIWKVDNEANTCARFRKQSWKKKAVRIIAKPVSSVGSPCRRWCPRRKGEDMPAWLGCIPKTPRVDLMPCFVPLWRRTPHSARHGYAAPGSGSLRKLRVPPGEQVRPPLT